MSVVISASPAAVRSMPAVASPRDPCRSASTPATGDAMSMPSASGMSLRPATMALSPSGPWK